jgi:hypothetical protein
MEKTAQDSPKNSAPPLANIGKRQQVAKANKMIFVWITLASVVIVICGVLSIFLVRQAIFNQKIINQKSKTNTTIAQNIENAKVLKENVDELIADTNLAEVRVNDADSNLKVIFDALPTTGDSTTLSNSLFSQIFSSAGVSTDSIVVGSSASVVTDAAVSAGESTSTDSSVAPAPQAIPFQAAVQGSNQAIVAMFSNLERVIRPMSISQFNIKAADNGQLVVSLVGESYYLSADTVKLGKTVVKP